MDVVVQDIDLVLVTGFNPFCAVAIKYWRLSNIMNRNSFLTVLKAGKSNIKALESGKGFLLLHPMLKEERMREDKGQRLPHTKQLRDYNIKSFLGSESSWPSHFSVGPTY